MQSDQNSTGEIDSDHESLFTEFERAYRSGKQPNIAEFADKAKHNRLHCVRELVKLDIEYQWKLGEERGVEQYLEQFPELSSGGRTIDDLIEEEFIVRRAIGKLPTREEIDRRFPADNNRILELLESVVSSPHGSRSTNKEFETVGEQGDSASTNSRVSSLALEEGYRIGHYVLREPLGRGAFAVVWRATDEKLQRKVAVKILRTDRLAHGSAATRMMREARAAARVEHPSIVQVYDVGLINEELPFIVSQFVDGPTLRVAAEKFTNDHRRSADIVRQIALALDLAHRHGIVHRDIKPANILMASSSKPMVTDFGLAQEETEGVDPTLTRAGDILGTPAYMAPEQARGDVHLIDARTDVYAVGAVLYKLLCDRTPFAGTTNSVIQSVIHERPEAIRKSNPTVSRDLETISMKCLEKEPQDRYHSAKLLADDLQRYLDGVAIVARPASRTERLWKWSRRNPRIAGLLMTLLTLIGFLLGTGVMLNTAQKQRDRAQAAERETQDLLGKSSSDAGYLAMQRGRFGDAVRHFDQSLKLGVENETHVRLKRVEALVASREIAAAQEELDRVLAGDIGQQHEGEVLLWQAQLEFETFGPDRRAEQKIERALDHYLTKDDIAYAEGMLADTSPDAVIQFQHSIAENPMHHRARRMLVTMLISLGRFEEALQEVRTARQLYASDVDFALLETLALSGLGKSQEAKDIIELLSADELINDEEQRGWRGLCTSITFLTSDDLAPDWQRSQQEFLEVIDTFNQQHRPLLTSRGIHPPPKIARPFAKLAEHLADYYKTGALAPLKETVTNAVAAHPEGSLIAMLGELHIAAMPSAIEFRRAARDRSTFIELVGNFERALDHPAIFKNAHFSARIGVIAWCLQRFTQVTNQDDRNEAMQLFMKHAREITLEETDAASAYTSSIIRGAMQANEFDFAEKWVDHWATANIADPDQAAIQLQEVLACRIKIASHRRNWSATAEYSKELFALDPQSQLARDSLEEAMGHLQAALEQLDSGGSDSN